MRARSIDYTSSLLFFFGKLLRHNPFILAAEPESCDKGGRCIVTSLFAIALARIRTGRIVTEKKRNASSLAAVKPVQQSTRKKIITYSDSDFLSFIFCFSSYERAFLLMDSLINTLSKLRTSPQPALRYQKLSIPC